MTEQWRSRLDIYVTALDSDKNPDELPLAIALASLAKECNAKFAPKINPTWHNTFVSAARKEWDHSIQAWRYYVDFKIPTGKPGPTPEAKHYCVSFGQRDNHFYWEHTRYHREKDAPLQIEDTPENLDALKNDILIEFREKILDAGLRLKTHR